MAKPVASAESAAVALTSSEPEVPGGWSNRPTWREPMKAAVFTEFGGPRPRCRRDAEAAGDAMEGGRRVHGRHADRVDRTGNAAPAGRRDAARPWRRRVGRRRR